MLATNSLLEGPPMPEERDPGHKKKTSGPPVWGFVVGMTSSFRRNTAVSKPRQWRGHDPNKYRRAKAEKEGGFWKTGCVWDRRRFIKGGMREGAWC